MNPIGYVIRKPTTILMLVFILAVIGMASYISLPRESAPDVKIPYMIVTTVYPGVAPEDIETLVTRPIERELKTIKDVKEINSSSSESFSVISIEFDPKVDLDYALQRVKDRVDIAKVNIPADAEDPTVTEINFENMPIMNVILTADYDIVKLKKIADDFAEDFETIPGVLEAPITGLLEREVQIDVDPSRLKDYGLGIADVYGTVMSEHVTIPAGTMKIGEFAYSVRVPGEIKNPATFNDLVVTATSHGPVYIRDVATVRYGFKERSTISRLNGVPAVTIGIRKRTGENIISITDQIKQMIEDRKPSLPAGTHISIGSDQSKFIRVMVGDLENNIINGFFLVIACILLFLGFTNSLFVAVSIPLSMLITFIVLQIMDISLNFIVLFSLILALGMLVDNAIVIVENIYRHRGMGKDAIQASEDATNEVAWAIISSTATTVAAFAPLLFWPGIMGSFMKYLPITVVIVLCASLFVALFINPVLCAKYMKASAATGDRFSSGGSLYGKVIRAYKRILTWSVTNPRKTLLSAFGALVVTIGVFAFAGNGYELFPLTDPDSIWIDVKGPVGLRLEETDAIARQLEETAKTFPDIERISSSVGVSTSSSGMGGDFDTTNEARIYLDFVDFEKRSQHSLKTFNESIEKIKYITGAEVALDMEDSGPPVGEPVEIHIMGEDYLRLGEIARDIRAKIKDVPGLVDIKDDFESSKPEIVFTVDREKAAILGVTTSDVAMAMRSAISGFDAGDFRDGDDDYDITVRFGEKNRSALPDLDNIFVFNEGRQIPISSLGQYKTAAGFGTIQRTDMNRRVTVTGQANGRLSADVLADVQEVLKEYSLPADYRIRYRGENEDSEEAAAFLSKALMVALFAIALILVTQFDSMVIPLIIMSSVILSLIGVLWGLIVNGMPFGIIMTGIGVISLAGVVVNNAIVMLDYTLKLRDQGLTRIDAIIEAGVTRFRPVILTALTTVVGIVPLATGWAFDIHTLRFVAGGSSSQWWVPMAIAMIYGLSFATVLTLVVVPALYAILGKKDNEPRSTTETA